MPLWPQDGRLRFGQLASVPVPHSGEGFASWVAPSAAAHKIPIDQMLGCLGLPASVSAVRYGVELTRQALGGR
ncbi:hypothetical protein DFJ66_2601 [Saccharothrix variisporea]|uniref:Uncharacterized protein n=1 Tax=Saccharothrix variisporea TaxID=543527 RepID=A0A495X4Z2_9PSEU|nr:hypothetical protein DFJ66_2601 [Saccharothrix variisporea]